MGDWIVTATRRIDEMDYRRDQAIYTQSQPVLHKNLSGDDVIIVNTNSGRRKNICIECFVKFGTFRVASGNTVELPGLSCCDNHRKHPTRQTRIQQTQRRQHQQQQPPQQPQHLHQQ